MRTCSSAISVLVLLTQNHWTDIHHQKILGSLQRVHLSYLVAHLPRILTSITRYLNVEFLRKLVLEDSQRISGLSIPSEELTCGKHRSKLVQKATITNEFRPLKKL